MSDTSPYGFELVRRGYDRAQVDERISKLVSDRDSALARITALEKRIEELHLETQNAQAQVTDAEALARDHAEQMADILTGRLRVVISRAA